MASSVIRVLGDTDVKALLDIDTCIEVVEEAFRQHGTGEAVPPAILSLAASGGGFHVKAGLLRLGRLYFAAKINGNFSANAPLGLPRIHGLVVLSDGETGVPLAVLDSVELTKLRTAAATAVAVRHLALEDATVATLCGCGAQGAAQLRAVARVRSLRKIFVHDVDPARARALAEDASREMATEVTAIEDLREGVAASSICITCTPSRSPILARGDVAPGTLIAAVGADSADKQEIDSALMASSTIVSDVYEQCATIGDLHHALASGLVSRADVHGDLGEIVAGKKSGRRSREEIIVFDSTGMALQDVAAAAAVYDRATASGHGVSVRV